MTRPELSTARLMLRPPTQSDWPAWADMLEDDRARFVGGPMAPSEAWRVMAMMLGHWELRGFGQFSVIERDTGACIGRVGPWMPEPWPGPEIGWLLRRDAEGKGYATEAAATAIDWAFDTLGWTDIIHCIDPANLPSIAVAERLGSRRVGAATLPPPSRSEVLLYGQNRAQWAARPRLDFSNNRHAGG